MTQISLSDVNDELAKVYCNASKKEQQKIKQIVEDAIVRLMQPPNFPTPKRRLLQKGERRPFKPFKAITMKGEGPSALEMVIQGRDQQ